MKEKVIITHAPEETIALAEKIAKGLKVGAFIALNGDLGAGKTMFVKGIAKGLGVKDYAYVNSPSFVILKEYQGDKKLFHFDVYRLDEKHFCETLDYEKYFYNTGVTVVEWAEKIQDIIPEEYFKIIIEYGPSTERSFTLSSGSKRYTSIIDNLEQET